IRDCAVALLPADLSLRSVWRDRVGRGGVRSRNVGEQTADEHDEAHHRDLATECRCESWAHRRLAVEPRHHAITVVRAKRHEGEQSGDLYQHYGTVGRAKEIVAGRQ